MRREDVKNIIIELLRKADSCSLAFAYKEDVRLYFYADDGERYEIGLNIPDFNEDEDVKREINDCLTRWMRRRSSSS
jgi:hypothetical protein